MSPAVIRGVARLHRDERPATRRAHLPAGPKLRFDDSAVLSELERPGDELDRAVRWRGAKQLHRVFGGDRAWWQRCSRPADQVVRSRPELMAIHERAVVAAGERTGDRHVVLFGATAGGH